VPRIPAPPGERLCRLSHPSAFGHNPLLVKVKGSNLTTTHSVNRMPPSMDVSSSHSQSPSIGMTPMHSNKQPSQKRNRIQLSCTNCRHSKLKCDRNHPCSQCNKRGKASICTFPVAAARRKPVVSMHNRLKHLESLVKDVMTSQSPSLQLAPLEHTLYRTDAEGRSEGSFEPQLSENLKDSRVPSSPNNERSSSSSGRVLFGTNESTYVGATHWAAILDDVCTFRLLVR
jgi:hypothetical protein